MAKSPTKWARVLVVAATTGLAVVTPVVLLPLPLAVVVILVVRWSRRSGVADGIVAAAVAVLIVVVAASAPVETIADRTMKHRMSVPKLTMTVAELREPEEHGLPSPRPRCQIVASQSLDARVVWFPSVEPTVGEFIAAIEAQTGMRHRFRSCGNGWTILWGADNITSLAFIAPVR